MIALKINNVTEKLAFNITAINMQIIRIEPEKTVQTVSMRAVGTDGLNAIDQRLTAVENDKLSKTDIVNGGIIF